MKFGERGMEYGFLFVKDSMFYAKLHIAQKTLLQSPDPNCRICFVQLPASKI